MSFKVFFIAFLLIFCSLRQRIEGHHLIQPRLNFSWFQRWASYFEKVVAKTSEGFFSVNIPQACNKLCQLLAYQYGLPWAEVQNFDKYIFRRCVTCSTSACQVYTDAYSEEFTTGAIKMQRLIIVMLILSVRHLSYMSQIFKMS